MHSEDPAEIKPLLNWFVGLTGVLVGSLVLCGVIAAGFSWIDRRYLSPARSPLAPEKRLPPEPRLQANPPLALKKLRQQEDEILSQYTWLDRPSGVVRIPIERAIELTAQEAAR